MDPITIALAIIGVGAGYGVSQVATKKKIGSAAHEAEKQLAKANKEAASITKKATEDAAVIAEQARKEEQQRRREAKETENRLIDREKSLDSKLDELDKRAEKLRKSEDEVEELKNVIRELRVKQQDKLEKIAKLTKAQAAEKLMQMTERDIKDDLVGLVNKLQKDAEDVAEEQAGAIIVSAMERMASDVTAERTVTAVKLEDEEMKGRIIGKEGRNIQALQRATGVDIMVDDTPGMIILSSFDPVRHIVLVRIKDELLLWQHAHRMVQHRKPADTRIKKRNFHCQQPPNRL